MTTMILVRKRIATVLRNPLSLFVIFEISTKVSMECCCSQFNKTTVQCTTGASAAAASALWKVYFFLAQCIVDFVSRSTF